MIDELFFLNGQQQQKFKLKSVYQDDSGRLIGAFERWPNPPSMLPICKPLSLASKTMTKTSAKQLFVKVNAQGKIEVSTVRTLDHDFETTYKVEEEIHV
jgi:hypothetical protein